MHLPRPPPPLADVVSVFAAGGTVARLGSRAVFRQAFRSAAVRPALVTRVPGGVVSVWLVATVALAQLLPRGDAGLAADSSVVRSSLGPTFLLPFLCFNLISSWRPAVIVDVITVNPHTYT